MPSAAVVVARPSCASDTRTLGSGRPSASCTIPSSGRAGAGRAVVSPRGQGRGVDGGVRARRRQREQRERGKAVPQVRRLHVRGTPGPGRCVLAAPLPGRGGRSRKPKRREAAGAAVLRKRGARAPGARARRGGGEGRSWGARDDGLRPRPRWDTGGGFRSRRAPQAENTYQAQHSRSSCETGSCGPCRSGAQSVWPDECPRPRSCAHGPAAAPANSQQGGHRQAQVSPAAERSRRRSWLAVRYPRDRARFRALTPGTSAGAPGCGGPRPCGRRPWASPAPWGSPRNARRS